MHFQIYQAEGFWRWRLRAANNEILADSFDSFPSRRNVIRSLRRIAAILGTTIETQGAVPIIEVLK